MSFSEQRERMVATQLHNRGISDPRVLEAMRLVPREAFVPDPLRDSAYADRALPIEREQTISQPYTVAFMCEALELQPEEIVLEIGTGSGYGAAVLSRMVRFVYTIERIPELAEKARETLSRLGYDNIQVRVGDGTSGLPKKAPFDAIIVTAGAETVPGTYRVQLAEGGRLLIPVGPGPGPGSQTMYRFTRHGEEFERESLGGFSFVPLIGAGEECAAPQIEINRPEEP